MNNNWEIALSRKSVGRLITAIIVGCLIFTSAGFVGEGGVYAAAKVKVKKVSFSKKNVDVTLNSSSSKVTIKLNKKVKGANCAYITLKNGKQKNRIATRSVKGKTITASLRCDSANYSGTTLGPGKWKVVKVELKKGKSQKKWQPSKISGGKYYPGFYYTTFKAGKNLATGTAKKKSTLTVNGGSATSTSVTGASSSEIGKTEIYTANVRSGGTAVSQGKVKFSYIFDSSTVVYSESVNVVNGVARSSINLPKPLRTDYPDMKVTAEYSGSAGKYRQSKSTCYTKVEKATLTLSDAKFTNVSGTTYEVSIKVTDSKGKPVANIPFQVYLKRPGATHTFLTWSKKVLSITTDSTGIAKYTLTQGISSADELQYIPQTGDYATFEILGLSTYRYPSKTLTVNY